MEKIIHPRAVKFDHFGGVDVLDVVEVDRPAPGIGQVLVRVRAAGINILDLQITGTAMQIMFWRKPIS